ncbi:condensation domain-containing protein [Enterococcus sp. LJL98]
MFKEGKLYTGNEIQQLLCLRPLQEKILFAEKHGKNYDIYFSVNYDPAIKKEKLLASLQYVMNKIDMFRCRIVKQENTYYFNKKSGENEFFSEQSLKDQKIDVLNGDRLARYFIDEREGKIEFLFHHLVFDNDALPLFLAQLETHLLTGEWKGDNENELEHMTHPGVAADYYRGLKEKLKTKKVWKQTVDSGYVQHELPKEVYQAVCSLSNKLKLTKFGVLFYVLTLVNNDDQHFIGVVTSRKDKLKQQQVINNYTDVVPIVVEYDREVGCGAQAMNCFKELFSAIYQSENGTFQQYMEVLGQKSYDYIVSYTKMEEEMLQLFDEIELGTYLYKFEDHFQFNEYKDRLIMECRYSNQMTKRISEHLEEVLLSLDRMDLTKPFISGQEPVQPELLPDVEKAETLDTFKGRKDQDLLFDSGISSLEIAQIITESYEQWGIHLAYQDVYGLTTFGELKELIKKEKADVRSTSILETHRPMSYTVPEYIKPMFIDSFRFLESEMYNIKYAMKLSEEVCQDLPAFGKAVEEAICSNDVFFTEFVFLNREVIGNVSSERTWKIETIEISDVEELSTIESRVSVQREQKLWDLKIVTVKNQVMEAYLFFNVHHMLIDDIGITILLDQIESVFHKETVEYIQYQQIEQSYKAATQEAIGNWKKMIPTEEYKNIGKDILTKGGFHKYEFKLPMSKKAYEQVEESLLNGLLHVLSDFFEEDRVYIGAMYHGRVCPYTDRIVHSFARTLPLYFDRKDSQRLKRSLQWAKENQAASMYDLINIFPNVAFPKIIYQTLIADKKESDIVTGIKELVALTKFQLFFNAQVEKECITIDTFIDPEIYSVAEEENLIGSLAAFFEKRIQEGDKN